MPSVITTCADRSARYAAIAIGASLPISSALDNVLLLIVLVGWLVSGGVYHKYLILKDNSISRAGLLLFALLTVGVAYSIAPQREALFYLSKYIDLLFIPLLLYQFRDQDTRRYALHALAISLACVLALSFVVKAGWMPKNPFVQGDPSSPTVFKLRLTHNILMAFGAFLFAWLGMTAQTQRVRVRVTWFALSALAVVNVTAMVQGATGYLILAALIVLFGLSRYGLRGTLYACAVLALLAVSLLLVPGKFHDRIVAIGTEIKEWRPDQPSITSAGLRLEFYHNTLGVISKYPVLGAGTGGFPLAYAEQVRGTGKVETRNPHSEFLNIMAQIGIPGLAALLWLFWLQWRSAARLDDSMERALARGLMVTMIIGCMLNSLLLDHTEGLFYAWLTGVLYGGLKYPPQRMPAPA